jgi:hypothetical protein
MAYAGPIAFPVIEGGTGDTSFTAYSVLTGGTTSTGALQNVSGVGTSGQVLTSNGASALPTWQASSAGSGNLVLIQSQTMSGSSVAFTTGITSTYSTYLFVISSVDISSSSTSILMTMSNNGGSTYASSNYQAGNFYTIYNGNTLTNANSTTNFQITQGSGTTQSQSANGTLWCHNIAQTSDVSYYHGEFSVGNGTSNYYQTATCYLQTTTNVNAFKFAPTSGTFSGGIITLFGILE